MYGNVLLLKNTCCTDMEVDLQHPVQDKLYFHQLEVVYDVQIV